MQPTPGMLSHPVHPTQLYEAFGCLLLSVALSRWAPRRQRFDGQTTLLFLIGYALLRFVIEYLRADDRGIYAGLSTSQWLSLLMLLAAAVCGGCSAGGRKPWHSRSRLSRFEVSLIGSIFGGSLSVWRTRIL